MPRSLRAEIQAQATVPAVGLRLLIVVLGATAFLFAPLPLAWVAFALAVLGAAVPRSIGCWLSAAIIALAQLLAPVPALEVRPFAVLLIVHVMHLSGALSLAVEWRGSLQLRALLPTARRLLAIQIPAAAVLAVVLTLGQWQLPSAAAGGVALLAACAAAASIVLIAFPRRGRAAR